MRSPAASSRNRDSACTWSKLAGQSPDMASGPDAPDHFLRELKIRLRALCGAVEDDARLAVGRRLRQAHVARNDRLEHLVAEMLFELRRHLSRQGRARVVHH